MLAAISELSSRMKRPATRTQAIAPVTLLMATFLLAQPVKYDGNWWLSRPAAEQEQFLWGYTGCEWDTLGLPLPYAGKYHLDYPKLRAEITQRYQLQHWLRAEPVGTAVSELLENQSFTNTSRSNADAPSTAEREVIDGTYWKGATAEERRGFVEGRIACFNSDFRSGKRFSKGIDAYVRRITNWYADPGHDEHREVGAVLSSLAD